MKMASHFISVIKDGEQVSFDRDLSSVLSTLRNGRYTIAITRQKERRNVSQNALMWMWFECISKETGTPVQDVHDYYCAKFLRKKIEWNNIPRTIVEGTSHLTKDRMTEFLENVQADAVTEFGIKLPDPDDRYFEDFYNEYE